MYALCAVVLGVWEAVAITSRRVPTVTVTARAACSRWPRGFRLLTLLWLFGLGDHLLRGRR